MATPRVTKINGQDVREQTLDEFLSPLDPEHCARVEVAELKQSIKDLLVQIEKLEHEKIKVMRELESAQTTIHKLQVQDKIKLATIRKHQKEKAQHESKVDEAKRGPEGDTEHSL